MERDRRGIRGGLEIPVKLGNPISKPAKRIRLNCDGCTD
jgi:hypothetical protein